MKLEEALKLADEAKEKGFLNPYPKACIILAAAVRELRETAAKKEWLVNDPSLDQVLRG